ncbi:MAG: hypothetical protein FWF08_09355 [Oscillospiraceae bacterium]|nr:hypothetical protein [Oscillospiraceae bacterium]
MKRFFGETASEQFAKLKKMLIITAVMLIPGIILLPFFDAGASLIVFAMYYWGWLLMKKLLKVATLGALLSKNIAIGTLILIAFFLVGYVGGFVLFLLGLCKFLSILAKRTYKNNG